MAKDYVFKVGDIPIKSTLILAPMDGLTDHPFREIIKRFNPGIIFSEFINAYDYLNNHPFFPQQIVFSEEQRPFAYQIFDNSPERILQTALYLSEKNTSISFLMIFLLITGKFSRAVQRDQTGSHANQDLS